MISLFLIGALLVGNSFSKQCHVHIREKGESFMEDIVIESDSEFGKIVRTKVPQHRHGKLSGVEHVVIDSVYLEMDLLNAFGKAKKSVCFVHKKTMDEPSEQETEESMEHGGCSELPRRGSVSNYQYLPQSCDGKLDAKQMKAAQKMCGNRRIVCVDEVEDSAEHQERRAIEIAIDHMQDESKRAVVREFTACNPESTMTIMTCDPSKLAAECTFDTKFCTYGLRCPLDLKSGDWTCQYNHKFAAIKCCDYKCLG